MTGQDFLVRDSWPILVLTAYGSAMNYVCAMFLNITRINERNLTRASATAASTSIPVFRMRMALTEAEIRA